MKYFRSLVDVVIVSDFSSQQKNGIHSGLLEAVKDRLAHPAYYIILLSFQSKEELLKHDTFGILSLQGTVFIRLPFLPEQLFIVIEKYTNIELIIPKTEWEMFSTKACKALLKEKISILQHGNKLDFINSITGPLRAAAVSSSSFPELISVVKQHLQSVKCYTAKEEIIELIMFANIGASLPDTFLQSISQFANGLQQLETYSTQEEININKLIAEIDKLNEIASKIQNY